MKMQRHDLPALADVVLRLADVCEQIAVPYAIGGAVATSFWGVPRTTQDADCLVAVPSVVYQRLSDALNAQGFEIEQPSGPQPVTVVALLEQVRRDKYMTLSCRATSVELFVPIVPLQDLILKRAVGRDGAPRYLNPQPFVSSTSLLRPTRLTALPIQWNECVP